MKRIISHKSIPLILILLLATIQLKAQQAKQLVVLDEAMQNKELIMECINEDMELLILPDGVNQLEVLTEKLKNYKNLEALHLLVCGTDGMIMLNGTPLQNENIGKYTEQLSSWKNSFTEDGDMMIYTCNLAESDKGKLVIRRLSAYTGLDVAASTNSTGNLGDKGDWQLEFMKGKIETSTCFNTEKIAEFPGKFERK